MVENVYISLQATMLYMRAEVRFIFKGTVHSSPAFLAQYITCEPKMKPINGKPNACSIQFQSKSRHGYLHASTPALFISKHNR